MELWVLALVLRSTRSRNILVGKREKSYMYFDSLGYLQHNPASSAVSLYLAANHPRSR